MAGFPLLSVLVFLPAVAGLLLTLAPRGQALLIKLIGALIALLTFVLSLAVVVLFGAGEAGPQLQERVAWAPALGVSYHLAIDGINLWLVVLTTFLTCIAMLAGWNRMGASAKEAFVLLLLLEAGVLGALTAFDLVLFFVFWEAMLIPMYLLIGLLGGEGRIGAALKFFIYTTVGSLFMLVAIIALGLTVQSQGNPLSFNLLDLARTPVSPAA
jgi:NADH-quinone oxidoreductase subunit M